MSIFSSSPSDRENEIIEIDKAFQIHSAIRLVHIHTCQPRNVLKEEIFHVFPSTGSMKYAAIKH